MAVVGTAIASFFTAAGAAGVGTFLTETFVGRLLVSVATSALLGAMAGQQTQRTPGITTQFAQTGADNALSFPIGTYATPGTRLCPWLSHGKEGGTPRAYLTLAVAVSAVPGAQLSRIAINGEWVELGSEAHADYGLPVTGAFAGYAWVKWLDGSQTAADPMMLAKYGSDPDFPWSADMVGEGMCLAFVTFRYNREIFSNLPTVVFETPGIPLYDPRKDSTAGGSGTHRWADRSTWEPSDNPMVQSYNVARGITLFTGDVWGGKFYAWRLPLASWKAGMDECEDDASDFRTGFNVAVDAQPAAVLKELGKGCGAQFAETAGMLKVRVGAPTLPVMVISDGDFLITKESTESPFPSASRVWNGARAAYPEPENIYASEDAPLLTDTTLEAEDNGQRNLADLQFGAVTDVAQVQRLAWSLVQDNRRFRRHAGSLQGAAALLEPLDALAWNSDRHGYTGKTFEIAEIAHDLRACLVRVSLLERDSADWSPPPEAVLPRTPTGSGVTPPDAFVVPGWQVTQATVYDSSGIARRPGIRLTWNGGDLDGVDGVQWQVQDAFDNVIASGTSTDVIGGSVVVTEGIVSGADYAARGRLVAPFPTDWTGWSRITAPTVLLSSLDIDPSFDDRIGSVASATISPLALEAMNVVERHDLQPDWSGSLSAPSYVPANLATHGNMSDAALWSARSGSFLNPSLIWVSDVDGDGTPGFLKDQAGRVWMHGTTPVSVTPGRSYRFSVDVKRSGDIAACRFTWKRAAASAPLGFTNFDTVDDGAWHTVTLDVSGDSMLSVAVDPLNPADIDVGISLDDTAGDSSGEVRARNFRFVDLSDPFTSVVSGDDLILTPKVAGLDLLYLDDTTHDLGAVFSSRVTAVASAVFWNADFTWDTWDSWDDVKSWAGVTAGSAAAMEISYTSDDPAEATASWSSWAVPGKQLITARAYRFRIRVTFGAINHRLRIPYAVAIIDVPDREERQRAQVCPAGGLTYVFDPPFMDTPAIAISGYGLPSSAFENRSNVSAAGFTVQFKDANGDGVACLIDFIAKGYGRKETT